MVKKLPTRLSSSSQSVSPNMTPSNCSSKLLTNQKYWLHPQIRRQVIQLQALDSRHKKWKWSCCDRKWSSWAASQVHYPHLQHPPTRDSIALIKTDRLQSLTISRSPQRGRQEVLLLPVHRLGIATSQLVNYIQERPESLNQPLSRRQLPFQPFWLSVRRAENSGTQVPLWDGICRPVQAFHL